MRSRVGVLGVNERTGAVEVVPGHIGHSPDFRVPPPVMPPLGRHVARPEDPQSVVRAHERGIDKVAIVGADDARVLATIRDALRSTPSLHERLIELRDVHAYEAAHEQERALACGAGETKREHDVAAAEHAGMERVLSAVLSLHISKVERRDGERECDPIADRSTARTPSKGGV